MQRNQLLAIVVIIVIVGSVGAYILLSPQAPTGQTLVWETIGNPDYMDPHNNYESFGSWVHYNVYETLYTYEWDSLSTDPTVPLLASGLEVSADGLNYTFTLRQGITFHDGTPFNASAVIYNFYRMLATFDPSGPVWMVAEPIMGGGAIEGAVFGDGEGDGPGGANHVALVTAWYEDCLDGSGAVIALDDYTVRIRLAYAYTPFLAAITYEVGAMMSPSWVEANGGIEIGSHNPVIDEETCGTGPYMVTEWTVDENIILERYTNYWRTSAARVQFPYAGAIDEIIIKTNEDVNSRLLNIKAGEADVTYVPATHLYEVYNNVTPPLFASNTGSQQSVDPTNLHVWAKYPTFSIASIHFTMTETMNETTLGEVVKNPYALKNVRKAFSYAFDYQTAIDNVLNGLGEQGQGPIPKGMFGHDYDAYVYPYNLTLATEYWNDAMTDDGLDDILSNNSYRLILYYNSGNEARRKAQLLLKDGIMAMLEQPGIIAPGEDLTIDVQGLEWSSYLGAARRQQVGCWMIGWAPDYADPDNYVGPYVSSTGAYGYWARIAQSEGWDEDTVDDWIADAAVSQSPTEREGFYEDIQEAIIEHAAYIWVWQTQSLYVSRANVYNGQYAANPMHQDYFFHMYKL
ncbi:MAG: ABC transporter substrate-binding protein [Candidatus Thorarchaeota archaeon]